MAAVKHIGPGSAFKVGMVLYGLLGLILGAVFALVSMLGAALAPPELGGFKIFFGVGATLFTYPIFAALEHAHSAIATFALVMASLVIVTGYTSINAIINHRRRSKVFGKAAAPVG